jgi:GTP-binding protein
MTLTIALVGRPNVGKSTLFNRLTGSKHALVDDQPGVTRDWREGNGAVGSVHFRLIDTAGFENADPESLSGRIQEQTRRGVAIADVVVLMVDARAGLLPDDYHFSDWLRTTGKPVILAANKCETNIAKEQLSELWALGMGEPLAISAAHGEGMADFFAALFLYIPEASDEEPLSNQAAKQMQVAIVGRPNAGKSTLMNAFLGEQRVLTGPEPGITRDSIAVAWSYKGTPLTLIDTAGMRKRGQVTEVLEQLSVHDARRAIKYAHVVVVVLDAMIALEKQDLTIIRQVEEEGRALVIALNKWDQVEEKDALLTALYQRLEHVLPQIRGVPVVPISALHERGLDKLMQAVFKTYECWNMRFPTSQLNRFLEEVVEAHSPPLVGGKRVKLQYITQVKSRPPSFVVFGTKLDDLPDSYSAYLTRSLRDSFALPGVPIRIMLRTKENPYKKD